MNDNRIIVREASPGDLVFMKQMLYEAANWRGRAAEREIPVSLPEIAKYLQDWGAVEGDFGLIAEDGSGRPVGAASYRLFAIESPGFGMSTRTHLNSRSLLMASGGARRRPNAAY